MTNPTTTKNRPPEPSTADRQHRADSNYRQSKWFLLYLLPFLAGLAVSLSYHFTHTGLPVLGEFNLVMGFALAMGIAGLGVAFATGLFKRTFPLWKFARLVGGIYVLWMAAGLVAIAVNILVP